MPLPGGAAMLTLRRIVLAVLLTALVIGCKPKRLQVGVEETPQEHTARKFKEALEAPEGPQLRP
jgi:hypothetical protein